MTSYIFDDSPSDTRDRLLSHLDARPPPGDYASVQRFPSTLPACMDKVVNAVDMRRIEALVQNWRRVSRGSTLFHAGDDFQNLYTIRAGSFKAVVSQRVGREQVADFYLPGETVGLDGIADGHHESNAVALEDSDVCVIQFDAFQTLCRDIRPLQQYMHRMLSAEIVRRSGVILLLGSMNAEQRVATFLLGMSVRLQARGYSPTEFNLRMTREDIGSYLGLQLETVSRMLSRFQQAGMIEVHGKRVLLTQPAQLRRLL